MRNRVSCKTKAVLHTGGDAVRTHDYLAHRAEDGRTQTIPAHLRGTAALARDFAQSFGAQELAYQTGLAHDAGKYSDAFQKRIRTLGPKVDHSTAGAQALGQLGLLSGAYCAAGHHGGLPDGGGRFDGANDPTLAGRLQKQVGSYDGFYRDITLSPPVFRKPQPLGRGGFTDSFWIRMLFSCLVDADFLDTEAFMQGGPPPRGRALNATALLQRLDAYVQPWWDAETPLNRARCAILRACMDAGAQKPGLFTLTVPTGGGKTVASLAFALRHAAAYGKKRIVYVIPFTSIIEQTADTFRDILGGENVL